MQDTIIDEVEDRVSIDSAVFVVTLNVEDYERAVVSVTLYDEDGEEVAIDVVVLVFDGEIILVVEGLDAETVYELILEF
ncbi:MAG: hypothetical protein MZU97_18300 [Bacillus subtilis]|nr:hypothetical protein [Bacillus subtilis]